MRRSEFNNKRKYIFLHKSNTNADSSSFSFIFKPNTHTTNKVIVKNYYYVSDDVSKSTSENIMSFFITFDKPE